MTEPIDPFDLVGKRIDRKYDVLRLVEETSFSVVYQALHVVWKRDVAIKAFKVPGHLTDDARSRLVASFIREGALLAELSERCNAIVQARDVASLTTDDGQWVPYMVLEWVEGEPLDVVLLQDRSQGSAPRALAEVMRLLSPVVEALALAHVRGIAHCDVKPGNILLLPEGQTQHCPSKLLDFGIARVLRGSAADTHVEGAFTPAYAAPEQWSSVYGAPGPATDVFAIALVVVELLTGQEALRGPEVTQLAKESCDPERRPTPRALGVDVGDQVERVLERALALKPENRYPDANEFWKALTKAAPAVRSTSTETDLVIPLATRKPRRSSTVATAMLLCAFGALGWHMSSQSAHRGAWLASMIEPVSSASGVRLEWLAHLFWSAPLLSTMCVAANALCIGTLLSVRWLANRACVIGDGEEAARLSRQLFWRWTVPSLVPSLFFSGAFCVLLDSRHEGGLWLDSAALGGLAVLAWTVSTARQVRRVASA